MPDDPKGAGIYNRHDIGSQNDGKLRLLNSIVAGNLGNGVSGGYDCYIAPGSTLSRSSGTVTGDDTCGGPATPGSIGLGPLANNGGPTATHALLAGSVAIDAVLDGCLVDHDQRNYGPRGSVCDSGAYERGVTAVGEPIVPAIEFGGSPIMDSAGGGAGNSRPQAFDLFLVALPGVPLTASVTAIDPDASSIVYTVIEEMEGVPLNKPSKGTVTLDAVTGEFTYTANTGSSGIDEFIFGACDGIDCDQGTVSIVINNGAVESSVIANVNDTDGTASPVVVIPTNLFATMSDPDFTYPLGAMFFDVMILTAAPSITVTLELPDGLSIDPNAVVRKMNRYGSWMSLNSTPDPRLSSAFFTPASGADPATVTLTLVDNDIFDHNLLLGKISDPVALGVTTTPTATATGATNTSGTGAGTGTTSIAAVADEGGGGIASVGWLSGLLLLSLWRRRRPLNLH